MPEYSYTTVPGKLRMFFEKIRRVAVPEQADHRWLSLIGLDSKNDPTLLGVLRQIGFIDHGGKPTRLWFDYKASPRETMAIALRESYRELFSLYDADPSPCELSTDELARFFSSKTGRAEGTVSKMAATFKALCGLADFRSAAEARPEASAGSVRINPAPRGEMEKSIEVNINIHLPETDDEEVYRKIFRILKEYLLS